jgi:hypothetical protein
MKKECNFEWQNMLDALFPKTKFIGGSGAMWNMGQNETSFYFCMKKILKLVSCKNRGMFHFAPCST